MPVPMTEAITEVRALLDQQTTVFYSESQLTSWVNQGCSDVARRAEILWQEVDFNVTPLQQTYAFPPDFLNAHRAEFTISGSGGGPADQTFNLEYRGINQMDEMWGILHSLPAAWPQFFTIRGNSVQGLFLMLYPSPAANGTLKVYYYRQALSAVGNANLDTLPGWEDIVYDYAVFKALRSARDPTWQEAYQLYEKNLSEMISKTRNFTDQAEQITTGNPSWPIYAFETSPEGW